MTPNGHAPGWKIDGCEMCEQGTDDSHQPDRVFVTTNREYARYYASRYGKGDLYVVEPVGALEASTYDAGIPTWSCERAKVLTVYDRCVILTRAQRWRVFRMMGEGKDVPTLRVEFDRMERAALVLARATALRRQQNAELTELDSDIEQVTAELETSQ